MNQMPASIEAEDEQLTVYKDRFFQSFRRPRTDAARAVVKDITNQIENYEKRFGLRKRKRKKADQAIFEATIAAVICDAIHRYCEDPNGRIAVTRSKTILGRKSRYRPAALGNTLPTLLDQLCAPEMGFIATAKGRRSEIMTEDGLIKAVGRRTTIQAGAALIRRIEENHLWFTDLGTSETEEIIILKDKNSQWEKGNWLEYEDTAETNRFREELRSINEWLAQAEIEFYHFSDETVDPAARRLRRVFNNRSFKQGGRLYGGFWMNLKEDVRRKDISIDGERVVELDYGQMVIRQLYGRVGVRPPQGDLYDIPGMPWRAGLKKVTTAVLYSSKPLIRFPKDTRKLFPRSIKYPEVRNAIAAYHAPIADYLFNGVGMELMFEEAEIMIEVLQRTRAEGIVVLPIHDSVLCPRSVAPQVKIIMEDAFENRTGLEAVVEVESS